MLTSFACDMTALSSEQRARYHELAALLQSSLRAIHELADGYEFEFPWNPETYNALAEVSPLDMHAAHFSISAYTLRAEATVFIGD